MFSAEQCARRISIDSRRLFLIAAAVCCLSSSVPAQQGRGQGEKTRRGYDLYSWKAADGWNFSVLYNTDRQKTVKEVFDPKKTLRGLNELKRRVSEIPAGELIVWFDRLTVGGVKVKGSEGLAYPPEEVITEIISYARGRGIDIIGPPGHPEAWRLTGRRAPPLWWTIPANAGIP